MQSKDFPRPRSGACARRALPRGVAAAVLLLAAACAPFRSAPAPLPAAPPAVEPDVLEEAPELTARVVSAPARSRLGEVAYDLPLEENSWVVAELDFLVEERRTVIERWIRRGEPYEPFIKQVLREHGVPTDLYHIAMIESGFLPTARSRAGAVGMWQFMSGTGRQLGLRVDAEVDERIDPVRSTRAAARHLRSLHREFGDWALAAAAYNAGSGRISRGMKAFEASDFWDLAQKGDLAAETRHYVPRLFAVTAIARQRDRFGFPAAATTESFAFDSIHVEYATPLGELARIGDASPETLARLNPHLLRGITPDGGYWVWVPAGQGEALQRAYLASDFRKERGLGTYVVRPGDSLGRIAQRSGVGMARIRELNPGVSFDPLRIGVKLRLPYLAARQLEEQPLARAEPRPEPRPAGREAPTPARVAAAERSHTVLEGETLWSIAREYGVSVARVQEANALEGATIRPGQQLRIPGAATEAAAAPTLAAAALVEHVVEQGDSLWSIARRYGSTVDAIRSANQLGERPIQPGQKLAIPTR